MEAKAATGVHDQVQALTRAGELEKRIALSEQALATDPKNIESLRLLARLRVTLFRALVPLAPARLLAHRGGDLLGRVIEDVSTLESLYVRILGPSLAAIAVAALVALILGRFSGGLALAAVLGLVQIGALDVAGDPAAPSLAGNATG